MRVAALYDVHGNLPALEAVLEEIERDGVDVVVSGGDLVSGPLGRACLERLLAAGAVFVRGNADREVPELADLVAQWVLTVELDVEDLGRVLFCHATPRSDDEIITRVSPEERVAAALEGVGADVVVCGHTHVQYDRRAGALRVVNAGSVGMPYEGRRGAFWAVLGPDVELRRTEYDVEAAARVLEATGYAGAADQIGWLLDPPDPDKTSEYFESQVGA